MIMPITTYVQYTEGNYVHVQSPKVKRSINIYRPLGINGQNMFDVVGVLGLEAHYPPMY